MDCIQQRYDLEILIKIKSASEMWKISNIEKLLSDCFENVTSTPALDYIKELNSVDVMQ